MIDIDAIRARDAAALAAAKAGINLQLADLVQALADRHDLLAEVDRLRTVLDAFMSQGYDPDEPVPAIGPSEETLPAGWRHVESFRP